MIKVERKIFLSGNFKFTIFLSGFLISVVSIPGQSLVPQMLMLVKCSCSTLVSFFELNKFPFKINEEIMLPII